YSDPAVRRCCMHGFTLLPMRKTCEERAQRLAPKKELPRGCAGAFLRCCKEGQELRERKRREGSRRGVARTFREEEFEDFFDNNIADLRRYFPHSWLFTVVDVSRPETRTDVVFPDSITSWEFQAVSLSASKGFCVAEPLHVQVFKELFVSLRLPYSVRRHEQLEIRAIIYNYSDRSAKLSVHMKGVEGLCSPGTSSVKSHEQVTVGNNSAQTVSFSVVPMVTGEIPITLVVFDPEMEMTLDSIEKTLHVVTEGAEKREEKTYLVNLAAKSGSIVIDGHRPDNTVPDSQTDLFVKVTGEIFNRDRARVLLTPEGISGLIRAPAGCAEQTMIRMSPVALAVRYLDSTLEWPNLRAGLRDTALEHISSVTLTLTPLLSLCLLSPLPPLSRLTAFVVKVLSQLQDLRMVNEEHVSESVGFLLRQQSDSGAFPDPQPVIHREMQGGVGGVEGDVSLTAFITIALHQALPMLIEEERTQARSSITKATAFLSSRLPFLQRPYAQAITAFCLSITQPGSADAQTAWEVLKSQAVQMFMYWSVQSVCLYEPLSLSEDECFMWEAKDDQRLVGETKVSLVPPAQAITVETTAYGLLTALENKDMEFAESVACWLSRQENYGGGFRSTQDTILALEALTRRSVSGLLSCWLAVPAVCVSVPCLGTRVTCPAVLCLLSLPASQRLVGNEIRVRANGEGMAKLQVVKVYHTLETEQSCRRLALKVQVEGKVTYTEEVLEDYSAYEDYGPAAKPEGEGKRRKKREEPLSEIEWFDARTRRRRDTGQSDKPPAAFTYTVCISHDPSMNLSGMAIVDITLLSGFEADTEDLDKLKDLSDQYISHYETTQGRVLLYFDEVPVLEDCVQFGARQTVPIGLVQPASATFYDYYEPERRCTVFYSAPRRSAVVSTLCSGEVCQCAESECSSSPSSPSCVLRLCLPLLVLLCPQSPPVLVLLSPVTACTGAAVP
ncbi:CO4 protein, partial [Atractosteus spatula]|nr:CO4 protein [Atractosteus spatula]